MSEPPGAAAYEHNGATRASRERFYAIACDPRRIGRGRGLRRRRQDLDAGVAHRARLARGRRGRLRAARDPRDHLHQEGGRRDARAAGPVAGGVRARTPVAELVPELVMRGMDPRGRRGRGAAAAGPLPRAAGRRAGRCSSAPSTPGSPACCAARRVAVLRTAAACPPTTSCWKTTPRRVRASGAASTRPWPRERRRVGRLRRAGRGARPLADRQGAGRRADAARRVRAGRRA